MFNPQVVKKIKAMVQQGVDVVLFQNGQYRNTVASMETSEGCPIQPGSSVQKVMYLTPSIKMNKDRKGIALDGLIKSQDTNMASSTLLVWTIGHFKFSGAMCVHANISGWHHRKIETLSELSFRTRLRWNFSWALWVENYLLNCRSFWCIQRWGLSNDSKL